MFSRSVAVLALASVMAFSTHAQDRYVDDTRFVPLRSGAGSDYRVVVEGVATGTPVTVVQDDRETGWSLVRTREGVEGWMPSRHLKREPGARYQVVNALRVLGQPDDGSISLATAITQARKELDEAAAEREALQAELAQLRELSGSASELDATNLRLSEEVQMLKQRIGMLEADNQRLRDESWQQWFINGVWATGMGGILTLLLPRLFPSRRRRSEWV
jgi:SH3 domain protein